MVILRKATAFIVVIMLFFSANAAEVKTGNAAEEFAFIINPQSEALLEQRDLAGVLASYIYTDIDNTVYIGITDTASNVFATKLLEGNFYSIKDLDKKFDNLQILVAAFSMYKKHADSKNMYKGKNAREIQKIKEAISHSDVQYALWLMAFHNGYLVRTGEGIMGSKYYKASKEDFDEVQAYMSKLKLSKKSVDRVARIFKNKSIQLSGVSDFSIANKKVKRDKVYDDSVREMLFYHGQESTALVGLVLGISIEEMYENILDEGSLAYNSSKARTSYYQERLNLLTAK